MFLAVEGIGRDWPALALATTQQKRGPRTDASPSMERFYTPTPPRNPALSGRPSDLASRSVHVRIWIITNDNLHGDPVDIKTYRLTPLGRRQRVVSKMVSEMLIISMILGGFYAFVWIKGSGKDVNIMLFAMPLGWVIALSYKLWEYISDAKKWSLSLDADTLTLDQGEQKGSFIKQGPPPVVCQKLDVAEIIEVDRHVRILNQGGATLIEFPREIESYDEVRSVLELWKSSPKPASPEPVAPQILSNATIVKYLAIVAASIAATWVFTHPAIFFPAALISLMAGFVLAFTVSPQDPAPRVRVIAALCRCAGVIIMFSTAYRIYVWFAS